MKGQIAMIDKEEELFSFCYSSEYCFCLFWWSLWISILKNIKFWKEDIVKLCLYSNEIFYLRFWKPIYFSNSHHLILTPCIMLPEHISKVLNAVQKPVISSKGLIVDFAIFIVTQLYMLVRAHASIEFFSSWNIWYLSWKILLLIDQILIIWPCVLKISYVHRVYCLEHKLIRNVFVKDTLKFLEEGNSILKMNP